MKHDWHDPRPNNAMTMMSPQFRQCRNCGVKQELAIGCAWMRQVSRQWLPLVGRCKKRITT